MNLKPLAFISLALCLVTLTACGGGGGGRDETPQPKMATSLSYSPPPGATGWRLLQNVSQSSPSHLVLDLVGPSGESGFGTTLELSLDATKASWSKVQPGDPEWIQNLRFDLGSGKPILKGVVKGNFLKALVFHKGVKGKPTAYSGPLVSIALDLQSGLQVGSEVKIGVQLAQELRSTGLAPMPLAVGKIVGN